ncbi:MAG: type II toxin-antitoxin system RelE/ParE family toxin [Bacteroidota bacterium]
MSYNIVYTNEFEKEIKKLSSKYPSLRSDFRKFIVVISENPVAGAPLGNHCYKVRLAIKSKGQGKSGGARVITCVRIEMNTVILVSIYDKSEKETISDKEIKERLKKYLG